MPILGKIRNSTYITDIIITYFTINPHSYYLYIQNKANYKTNIFILI